jgi:hypothetical protein
MKTLILWAIGFGAYFWFASRVGWLLGQSSKGPRP